MKTTRIIFVALSLLFLINYSCEKKKPPDIREDPSFYFPINYEYIWTYVLMNTSCEISPDDSFSIAAVTRNTRNLLGYGVKSGWDLVSSTGGITFVYHEDDAIFTIDIGSTTLPAKVLVGPIKQGTFWKDDRGYEYVIIGFDDIYCEAAGGYFRGCARIRRTIADDPKKTDFWWAPQVGKVRRMETNLGGQCVSGEEIRRLDKSPEFP